jgi:hypothetical protein
MKWVLFKRKVAKFLVKLAVRIDPLSKEYQQYILDKAIQHAIVGGMIKIEWVSPEELKEIL